MRPDARILRSSAALGRDAIAGAHFRTEDAAFAVRDFLSLLSHVFFSLIDQSHRRGRPLPRITAIAGKSRGPQNGGPRYDSSFRAGKVFGAFEPDEQPPAIVLRILLALSS